MTHSPRLVFHGSHSCSDGHGTGHLPCLPCAKLLVVNIGPIFINYGVQAPLVKHHEIKAPQPRFPQVLDDAQCRISAPPFASWMNLKASPTQVIDLFCSSSKLVPLADKGWFAHTPLLLSLAPALLCPTSLLSSAVVWVKLHSDASARCGNAGLVKMRQSRAIHVACAFSG